MKQPPLARGLFALVRGSERRGLADAVDLLVQCRLDATGASEDAGIVQIRTVRLAGELEVVETPGGGLAESAGAGVTVELASIIGDDGQCQYPDKEGSCECHRVKLGGAEYDITCENSKIYTGDYQTDR